MYDPDGTVQAAFGLTDDECLWEKIEAERLISLIERSDVRLRGIDEGENDYGRFLFVYLDIPGKFLLDVYGLGYHDHRERHITNFRFSSCRKIFSQNDDPYCPKQQPPKWIAIMLIRQRVKAIKQQAMDATALPRSAYADTFELVADLTDDDFAMMNCE